jgi:hypothetical protein
LYSSAPGATSKGTVVIESSLAGGVVGGVVVPVGGVVVPVGGVVVPVGGVVVPVGGVVVPVGAVDVPPGGADELPPVPGSAQIIEHLSMSCSTQKHCWMHEPQVPHAGALVQPGV